VRVRKVQHEQHDDRCGDESEKCSIEDGGLPVSNLLHHELAIPLDPGGDEQRPQAGKNNDRNHRKEIGGTDARCVLGEERWRIRHEVGHQDGQLHHRPANTAAGRIAVSQAQEEHEQGLQPEVVVAQDAEGAEHRERDSNDDAHLRATGHPREGGDQHSVQRHTDEPGPQEAEGQDRYGNDDDEQRNLNAERETSHGHRLSNSTLVLTRPDQADRTADAGIAGIRSG
jgi:hypothetical protein